MKLLDEWTDLLPLLDPLVDKLREGFSMDESAMSWRHLQLALLVDHLTPGDRDYGHTVALHAFKDVVVQCLVVCLGRDFPNEIQRQQMQDVAGQLIVKHLAKERWDAWITVLILTAWKSMLVKQTVFDYIKISNRSAWHFKSHISRHTLV